MRKRSHSGMKKLAVLAISVLVFTLYLVYSYNNHTGRSYIFEPVYISLTGSIPENTSLRLNYQTFNDPTISEEADLLAGDSIPANTYIFVIDSSYRLTNFSIYFQSLQNDEEIIISQIKASNDFGGKFIFSLKSKDLMATENLTLEQLDDATLSLSKIPSKNSTNSTLTFTVRSIVQGVFVRTNTRDLETPSLLALLAILILGAALVYSIYPVIANFTWSGITMGAYLLALAILIMPSGEKSCNLTLALAIVAGLIEGFRKRTLRIWVRENRRLLLLILTLTIIYSIAFLFSGSDPSTANLLKIKYGLPFALMAVAFNTNNKQEIRLQYLALFTGVVISIFIHIGWTLMLIDVVEQKLRLLSDPLFYIESVIFSRIHHSYLSVLYLAVLSTIFLKKDIISLHRKEAIFFSLFIVIGILFAFSRAAILSLILILIYYSIKWAFSLLKVNINRSVRFIAASVLMISLLAIVFSKFEIDSLSSNSPISGLLTRMEIWGNASELIRQKPIAGWGPGSFTAALNQSNLSTSFNSNTWSVLNTHNQFLETSGMFGLFVGVSLVWLLLFPTGFSRQHKKYSEFIITAAIIFITSFFFESFLNRNLGILVFGLIYGLLIKMKSIYDS